MITIIRHGFYFSLFVVLLLFTNTEAKGGGRGGGRGRGRGGHRGGGGLGWAFSSYSSDTPISLYGNSFGKKGLPDNSYIANENYKYSRSNGFLISSLFFGAAKYNTYHWDDEKEREWRETTRAPYFDNKLPGDDKIFPASAVVGAATAFGLVSLLPLNVPPGKPLMYCGNTDLIQSKIQINYEDTYVCKNKRIEIECRYGFDYECVNEKVQCDLKNGIIDNIYCSQETLFSKTHMYCDESRKDSNSIVTLICHEGQLPKSQTSFIPTTSTTTEYSFFSTTPKPLSFNANVHVFLLKLMGKSDVLETTTPESFPYPDSNAWHPEALTIKPETTSTTSTTPRSTTTKDPIEWMEKEIKFHDDGSFETTYRPLYYLPFHLEYETASYKPPHFYRIDTRLATTTEAPFIWMIKYESDDPNKEARMTPLPRDFVEIAERRGAHIPFTWVKVPVSKVLERTTQKSYTDKKMLIFNF